MGKRKPKSKKVECIEFCAGAASITSINLDMLVHAVKMRTSTLIFRNVELKMHPSQWAIFGLIRGFNHKIVPKEFYLNGNKLVFDETIAKDKVLISIDGVTKGILKNLQINEKNMNIEDLARICHEAKAALCATEGGFSQSSWIDAADWEKEIAITRVKFILDNPDAKPEDSQDWLREKTEDHLIGAIIRAMTPFVVVDLKYDSETKSYA